MRWIFLQSFRHNPKCVNTEGSTMLYNFLSASRPFDVSVSSLSQHRVLFNWSKLPQTYHPHGSDTTHSSWAILTVYPSFNTRYGSKNYQWPLCSFTWIWYYSYIKHRRKERWTHLYHTPRHTENKITCTRTPTIVYKSRNSSPKPPYKGNKTPRYRPSTPKKKPRTPNAIPSKKEASPYR